MVLRDDIARPQCNRIIKEYKNQQNIASLPWLSLLPDLKPYPTQVGQARLTFCKPETSSNVRSELNDGMRQIVIRQYEAYTHHKPEVVNYYEPVRDFWHQILKVYAPNRKF